jgi:DNA-binding NarL/FixJ family response regulator
MANDPLEMERWTGKTVASVVAARNVISVAVIEDNRLVREGIAALLNERSDVRVVAARAGTDPSALREAKPHVILLDHGLRSSDSVRVAEQIKKELPESKVILMDVLPMDADVMLFVRAGVSGFIMKEATLDELVGTIQSVAAGAHVLPPPLTGTLFSQIARTALANRRAPALKAVRMTHRERQVVHLIAEGLGNKEIAARLHIATHTVKSHVRNVMDKLAMHTRLQIAAYAHSEDDPEAIERWPSQSLA